MQENYRYLLNYFQDSKEALLILDENKEIIYINNSAKETLGEFDSLSKIEHHFNFDICVLKEEEIATFNPLTASINTHENYKSEALYQVSQDQYKNLILRSYNIDALKVIIITDLSSELENTELKEQQVQLINRVTELEEFSRLKDIAEAQAVRVGLINRISTSIRDSLDIDEIIRTAISEISRTLGVYRGIYASFTKETGKFLIRQEWHINNEIKSICNEINIEEDPNIRELLKNQNSQTSIDIDITDILAGNDAGELRSRLATPVIYQGEILGIMLFYHVNSKKIWHPEEISLVDGISAQVAAAVSQASLFEQVANQKQELEHALVELKRTQAQLIQSEKMASLGKLVAGVAHEINTPIGSLSSNVDILVKLTGKIKEKMQDSEAYKSYLDVLDNINTVNVEAVKRINAIVKSLKNFARLDEAELKQANIHDGIKSTLMLINHEIKDRIRVVENYGEIPEIECYPNLLNQVFMNMLVNAYQSIDGNGIITITSELKNNRVFIVISDTGKGIAKEDLPKIFDPGFTTKGVGIGTGLGLSICYQIIEKHHGIIKVVSEIGQGTTFTIDLPLKQTAFC